MSSREVCLNELCLCDWRLGGVPVRVEGEWCAWVRSWLVCLESNCMYKKRVRDVLAAGTVRIVPV